MKTNQGYKIESGHFRLGSKIHLQDFIYAKRLLQNNFYASGFAFLLAKKIEKEIKKDSSIKKLINDIKNDKSKIKEKIKNIKSDFTLIGYGYYSELLISRIETFLVDMLSGIFNNESADNNDSNYYDEIFSNILDHCIVENENNIDFSIFLNKHEKKDYTKKKHYYFIITPISTTLITPIKIENEFIKQLGKKQSKTQSIKEIYKDNINFHYFSLVLVADDNNRDNDNLTKNEKVFWVGIDFDNKIVKTINRELEAKRDNHYFVKLHSKWYLPDKCSLCSIEDDLKDKKYDPSKEYPLYYTDKVSVTPTFNFGVPDIFSIHKIKHVMFGKSSEGYPVLNKEMINFGHFKRKSKHFFYYIKYEETFKKNISYLKKRISEWNIKIKKKVLLIAPDKNNNGLFVNFINEEVFRGKANILNIKAETENIYNFYKFFNDIINEADCIFYVDNLMATAGSFYLINDLLKIRNLDKNFIDQKKENEKSFSGIFTLINRLDKFGLNNLKRKLKEKDKIYSFFDILFPVIPVHFDPVKECHLCRKEKRLEELIEKSALDTTKLYFKERILKKIKGIPQKEIPINDTTDRQLYRLFVAHYLFYDFSKENGSSSLIKYFTDDNLKNDDYEEFVKEFSDLYSNFHKRDDSLDLTITIIKVLSEPPFVEYKIIKDKVFKWAIYELHKIIEENKLIDSYHELEKAVAISKDDSEIDSKLKSIIKLVPEINNKFGFVKTLIKSLATLNSNYLLSEMFIEFILEIIGLIDNNNKIDIKRFYKKITQKTKSKNFLANPKDSKPDMFYQEKINILEKNIDFSNKMRINILDLKLYVTSYIKLLILNNEIKAIKLDETLDKINSVRKAVTKESHRFIELLKLENIGLIETMLSIQKNIFNYTSIHNPSNLSYNNKVINIDKIEEDKSTINKILKTEKEKNNIKVKNACEFVISKNSKKNKNGDILSYLLLLNRFLTLTSEDENTVIKKNDTIIRNPFEEKAKYLLQLIIKIMGIDEKKGGGLILYKLKEKEKNISDKFTIISSYGSNTEIHYDIESSLQEQLFSTNQFINGYEYMEGSNKVKYHWSCISALKYDNKWTLQDGEDFNYTESKIGDKREINRFLFIRISKWDNKMENLNGKAVIVLYDDNESKFSESKIRYILSIRNKIAEFLEKNYNNDAYRSWLEAKKIEKQRENFINILKSRSNKFNHGALTHLKKLQDEITNIKDESDYKIISKNLYYLSTIIQTDLKIGNIFSKYLINNFEYEPPKSSMNPEITKDSLNKLFTKISKAADFFNLKVKWNIDKSFKDYNSDITIEQIETIVFEIFINAIKSDNQHNELRINVSQEYIEIINKNGKIIKDFDSKLFYEYINSKEILSRHGYTGIGLFIINKIINYYFGESISVISDKENKKFTVKFRIKK